MKLSPDQVKRFWREWPKACHAQNWTRDGGMTAAEIDAKRKEFLLRCGFKSLTDVDKIDGFTKVLKELVALQGVGVNAGIEADNLYINQARVLRHQIVNELIPCLELYIADVPAYITTIMEDKNRWWKIDRPVRDITIMDLSAEPVRKWSVKEKRMAEWPSPLKQLQYTLAARLNTLRNDAGDTIHDMKKRAGVPCGCMICARAGMAANAEVIVEEHFVPEPETEDVPF